MNNVNPNGVWPVMLTPFTKNNEIDYEALERLTNWYIDKGVSGLFSCCQSSEMFFLSDDEMHKITKTVKKISHGRVPVISSGHTAEALSEQAKQIVGIHNAGADVVILITNRLAKKSESDAVWLNNLQKLLDLIPDDIKLGLYECPYPYKRLISLDNLEWVSKSGRFYFLKDTSCNAELIEKRVKRVKDTPLKIFNANTATLLETLQSGVSGYSGVMAGFHPDLYKWLIENAIKDNDPQKVQIVDSFLTIAALIERQVYPVNAKFYLNKYEQTIMTDNSRALDSVLLGATEQKEIRNFSVLTEYFRKFVMEEKKKND
ncbi:dihydrodipicolinate synthase family protein [Oenococcus sp. UCMA 17063]|nr:dihydrodipicolinate synthase family protein [Oenococcus sp. UCMA 17063]